MEIKLQAVLKRELKTRNESINEIARNCKIPVSSLHGWTQGTLPHAKNLHLLKTLAEYLGISLSMLLFNVKDTLGESSTILFSSQFVDGESQYRLVIEKIIQMKKG